MKSGARIHSLIKKQKVSWQKSMFLHIGEGLLVKKRDIIAILDARKMVADEHSPFFFEEGIKSFVVVDTGTDLVQKRKKGRNNGRRSGCNETVVLVSAIASTTLQKRFYGNTDQTAEIESREMYG